MNINKKKIQKDIVDLNSKLSENFKNIELLSAVQIDLLNDKKTDHALLIKNEEDLSSKLLINKLYLGLLDNLNMILKQFDEYDSIESVEINDIEIDELSSLREEWMVKTKEKEVLFNDYHPFYDDELFFKEIFSYFENIEEYEMCKYLLNIQKLKTQQI